MFTQTLTKDTAKPAEGQKVEYADWQRFRDHLAELRPHYSWSEISALFDHVQNGGPGWAERANEHRSLVSERDLSRGRALMRGLEATKAKQAEKDRVQERVRSLLLQARERTDSWVAVTKLLGKNPKSSGYYAKVANGKERGSKKLLATLRELERNGFKTLPKAARAYSKRVGRPTAKEQDEIRARLHALHARLNSWQRVGEQVKGSASYFQKIAAGKNGGSKGLLQRLRRIPESETRPAPAPAPTPEPQAKPAAERPAAEPVAWPLAAQEHLRAALAIVEQATGGLPKAMRGATSDVVTQLRLLIDELEL